MAKRNDATGHTRGAGEYSRGYVKFERPTIPKAARDIYGAVDGNGSRNGGFAAPVSKGAKEPDKDD